MLKRFRSCITLFFIFSFSIVLLGDEVKVDYFPSTLGSYWIYEDQDGDEVKRTVIEGEEIAGETYHAFEYEPELKNWANYSCFIHPLLFQISDKGITLADGNEINKGYKERLTNEIESFINIISVEAPDQIANISFNIKVECKDSIHFLLRPITLNEEWDVKKINANITMTDIGNEVFSIDFTIMETGIFLKTETVETAAGKFEDCLKVMYQTETLATFSQDVGPDEVDPPGETVTTVWFAPNVGIVKVHQEINYTFLNMLPDDEDIILPAAPAPKMLELKKYVIKKSESEDNSSD